MPTKGILQRVVVPQTEMDESPSVNMGAIWEPRKQIMKTITYYRRIRGRLNSERAVCSPVGICLRRQLGLRLLLLWHIS